MTISKKIIQDRQEKLTRQIRAAGLDAFAVNPSPSMHYLTGLHFHLSERPVVIIFPANGDPTIVLPELEKAKLEDISFPIKGFPYREDPNQWGKVFEKAIQYNNLKEANIGVEPRALRFLELKLLEQAAQLASFIPSAQTISALRMYKDENEINAMRKAVHIAQDALNVTFPYINAGATEKEISTELTMQLLKHGSNPRLPFFPIVSAGPNSANPHAAPTDRKLFPGDLLVIDYGANVDGYFSDITRTFAVGDVEPEFKKIAELVLGANQAGHAAAGPGIPAGDIDRAARLVIETAGYGEFFIHRTGHGLGLEGHEEPYIRGDNLTHLKTGMSFTIEPGIYLPNRGGVRIEDDVVITEMGCESLTDLPRELINLG